MDDPNITNEQPAAELPQEANLGESESPAVQLPAAPPPVEDSPPEPAAEAPSQEASPPLVVEKAAAKTPPPPLAETPAPVEEPKSEKMDWYILKIQSNREESIREVL